MRPASIFFNIQLSNSRDDYGFQKEISEKPDVISLEAGKTFCKSYSIGVHKK